MPRAVKGQRFGGRVKGTPNKLTAVAKDVINGVATALGGQEGLLAWVREDKENERIFWASIYPKLLPFTIHGDPNHPIVTRQITEETTPEEAAEIYEDTRKSSNVGYH